MRLSEIQRGSMKMGRYLNVGIIQQPIKYDTAENLRYIEEKVEAMMDGVHGPELIVGVEGGIGYFTPQSIPGPITDYLCAIAKKHGIYFVPGTMYEEAPELDGMYYNSAPVINPEGEIIVVYRKMAPWRPAEDQTAPGKDYVVFDIPEKQAKIGVQICYDLNFPEISRNQALMGAEVLLKLTQDPEELYNLNKPIHFARALENQAYLVSTNTVGKFGNFSLYGNSLVVNPEGKLLWEAGTTETTHTITLDLDVVSTCREYGTLFMDHYMKHLKQYDFPQPYNRAVSDAPLYEALTPPPNNQAEYDEKMREIGVGTIRRGIDRKESEEATEDAYVVRLQEFLGNSVNPAQTKISTDQSN